MAIKKKQGDSIWLDITAEAADLIDDVWVNWTGSWAVAPTIGATPVISGTLTKDATELGKFYLRITTTQAALLSVGTYYLTIQVDNTTVDYRQEIAQEKITITAQGIV